MNSINWKEIYDKIMAKTAHNAKLIGADFPKTGRDGIYEITDEIHDWTNGFWPGLLWILYLHNSDEKAKKLAQECEKRLDTAFINHITQLGHDVGFVNILTSCTSYRLFGNTESYARLYAAASVLASRFNIVGRYIRSWNDLPGKQTSAWSIADNMMNIPLLYYASEVTKDPRFSHIATAHAKTMQKYLIRDDGSTNHIICFNPETGEPRSNEETLEYTQGRDTLSSWTRGCAWVLCGFTYCYSYTKDKEFLDTAKKCARFFIQSFNKNKDIFIDFSAPNEGTDTSAAAIASSGLLELAKHTQKAEKKEFTDGAVKILSVLHEKYADYSTDTQCILNGAATRFHGEGMRDVSLIYGDFFYAEAINKYLGGKTLYL